MSQYDAPPTDPRPLDPRPLPGEPLSLDLLNTRWNGGGTPQDLLDSVAGLARWLAWNGLADRAVADRATLDALLAAREAIARLADVPGEPQAVLALNEVLAHGWISRTLGPDGPQHRAEADAADWLPAWIAADDYLRLLAESPDRIRSCAHPDCVLHFYDTSKNGTRRWCSMASCGNRAKASRHYAKTKSG
ncbi:putative RNA-binding Zn ribbon-like protein [Kitasatospora sp. MAP12-15]|uniref:CGNR zinc finger domain-containing protein n=1 Tax=unclassified Kitasatospora TaxID=2633591 RepID=UPI002474D95D|nr:CGNR zinc finger domain-containing protein [Kitasatospora sp. MAP12-44]MDH6113853.1 putative RNA-binding Zn ribbon-like protein [Kitasatospora sp. MAP12-44]